jgi:DNA invertase Pin-like site-specific DNA recombinase
LKTQQQQCSELVKKKGFRVIETFEEKRSAKASGTRPGFKEMVKLCNKGLN